MKATHDKQVTKNYFSLAIIFDSNDALEINSQKYQLGPDNIRCNSARKCIFVKGKCSAFQ